jgi:hypothetical protein
MLTPFPTLRFASRRLLTSAHLHYSVSELTSSNYYLQAT